MDKPLSIFHLIYAFSAGVIVVALIFLHYEVKTPKFPIICPEGLVCYRTDDHTIWEFSECVLDFTNNIIVCKLVEGKVKHRTTS